MIKLLVILLLTYNILCVYRDGGGNIDVNDGGPEDVEQLREPNAKHVDINKSGFRHNPNQYLKVFVKNRDSKSNNQSMLVRPNPSLVEFAKRKQKAVGKYNYGPNPTLEKFSRLIGNKDIEKSNNQNIDSILEYIFSNYFNSADNLDLKNNLLAKLEALKLKARSASSSDQYAGVLKIPIKDDTVFHRVKKSVIPKRPTHSTSDLMLSLLNLLFDKYEEKYNGYVFSAKYNEFDLKFPDRPVALFDLKLLKAFLLSRENTPSNKMQYCFSYKDQLLFLIKLISCQEKGIEVTQEMIRNEALQMNVSPAIVDRFFPPPKKLHQINYDYDSDDSELSYDGSTITV